MRVSEFRRQRFLLCYQPDSTMLLPSNPASGKRSRHAFTSVSSSAMCLCSFGNITTLHCVVLCRYELSGPADENTPKQNPHLTPPPSILCGSSTVRDEAE